MKTQGKEGCAPMKAEIQWFVHKPRKAWGCQELEETRPEREHGPLNTLISDLWSPALLEKTSRLF